MAVVDNINVGGTGNPPLVIALGKLLVENGIAYAVVSKGYVGNYTQPTVVEKDDLVGRVGDDATH